MMNVPRIAITPGEPAGIGPDIVIMAAQGSYNAELVAVADPTLLAQRAQQLGLPLKLEAYQPQREARQHMPGTLRVAPVTLASACASGQLDAGNANYVLQTLTHATQGCVEGEFQAIITAPVQKSIINEAGIPFTGHTEFLADLTATPQVVMMLAAGKLRVALVTTHLPLSEVPGSITCELLTRTLHILQAELQQKFHISQPTIAVLGLNPHAGENGHMGREEIDIISPTLDTLRAQGMNLLGPLPADTAFQPKVLDQVDAVCAMYHDQGLPVLKYAGFGRAVNITLGLPIVRVSVDHGTALDLAGTGSADPGSLLAAIDTALEMISPQ